MYEYKIKEITHFVDGDTFDCMIDLGFDILHKIRVRMYGMNTPESRTRDLDEKKRGLESKDKLVEMLTEDHLDFKLILKTKEKGKSRLRPGSSDRSAPYVSIPSFLCFFP